MSTLKQKVVKGVFWSLMEKLGVQMMGFVVSMVLARLLTPADYGTIALLTIFIAIAGCLADSGFGTALVQKKDATEVDFNSVFYLSLFVSGLLYAGLYFAAPLVAVFYKTPILVPVLRVLALSLVFNAINSIQNAELQRKLLFHLSFRISLIGSVVTGIVGVALAFLGYGVWALVWSQLTGGVVGVLTRWYFIAWRPKWMFSWGALKGLFSFGWKMAVSGLLDTAYGNLYGLLIGRLYTRADLAFVQKGRQVPELAMNTINGTLMQVTFPALAQMQDRRDTLWEAMRKMIRVSTFCVFPLMTGCACCADPTVYLLFGEQWLPAVPYVRIACFTFALWPFHTINLQAIKVLGRSDLFLMLEIIKKTVGLIALFLSARFGVWWMMAVSAFVLGPLGVVINAWPNRKLLNYSVMMQCKDVLTTILLCGFMAIVLIPVLYLAISAWAKLLIQVPLGVFIFAVGAFLLKPEPCKEIIRVAGPTIKSRLPAFLQSPISKMV